MSRYNDYDRDEIYDEDNGDEIIGHHLHCGGTVRRRVYPGRGPSFHSAGEPDEAINRCSECDEEPGDDEIVSNSEKCFPCPTCGEPNDQDDWRTTPCTVCQAEARERQEAPTGVAGAK